MAFYKFLLVYLLICASGVEIKVGARVRAKMRARIRAETGNSPQKKILKNYYFW